LQREQKEDTKHVATVGEGGEKTSSPKPDAVSTMLVADTVGTSTSSLTIKKEIMKKKGLPVEKAIDTTACGKNSHWQSQTYSR